MVVNKGSQRKFENSPQTQNTPPMATSTNGADTVLHTAGSIPLAAANKPTVTLYEVVCMMHYDTGDEHVQRQQINSCAINRRCFQIS